MRYEIIITSTFKRELKIIKKRKKDICKLRKVVNALANNEILDKKYKDHSLVDSAEFKGCRECHVEPDWLLVYKKNKKDLILLLVETGTHSDLFK